MSHAMTPTTLTALMLFIIPPAGSVHAATIYVPGDHPTIQEAIDAAQNYDTVVVSPSTYQENISFGGKLITLTGTDPSDPGIVATTIIDGGGLGPVVTFVGTEGPDAVLAGLTITNGWGTYGGGVQGSRTGARILDCAVIDNQADFGGGIYGCDGEITRCEVSGNTAEWDGGGIYRSDALIYDCTISKNQASNGDGGGLHDCHGDIEACTISSNGADSQGGGLAYCNGTITDSVIGANSSGLDGGGLYDCMGTIDGCTITNNTTVNAGGGLAYCGGTISRCTISGNVSLHEGGGLANCSGEVVSCIIRANFSLGDQSGNYGHGGGLSRCYATIANSLISGNKANRDGGGFYRCYAGTIRNSTIVGNLAMAQGGGLKECTGQVTSCILWSNRAADGSHQWLEGSSPQYSCIEGLKNIAADPLFVDPGHWDRNGTPGDYTDDTWIEGDYHLTAASPTINAGDPGYTPASGETDIDGDPRLNHGRVDIGADEFPIDCNTNGVNDDLDFTAGTSLDCNGNDVPDECDVVAGTSEDCNSNLVPDLCDVALSDCNGNDVPDECDVVGGTSEDCNSNLIPDLCEVPFSAQSPQLSPLGTGYSQSHVFSSPPVATTDVALTFTAVGDLGYSNEYVSVYINESYVGRVFQYSGTDCPSLPDVQEITVSAGTFNAALAGGDLAINMNASSYVNATQCSPMSYISVAVEHGPAGDCNGNRVPDACDLADGTSTDCDTDGLPDECQLGGRDCNTNSLLDDCEIAAGTAGDCDTDGLPDECQLEGRDCNTNGLLDDCEVAAGTAADCDSSGLPDMCELDGRDCNVNGFLDDCEVSAGTSEDCNTNQLPDECDLAGGTSADVNTTGVPDECEGWVLYVDDSAPAGGNGRSWAAPYNDLQKALHSAVPGDAIHVAQGTYAPAGPGWDRPATFQLRSGVGLYGGYAGYGQPEPDARNCALYETVLTGDLNGDDGSVGTSENSYHVVTVSSVEQNTVLDGFTIKAGIADGSSPHNDGGAMYINNDGGSVVVRACSFSSNLADSRGGAVYNAYGDSSFLRCTWDGN
ncbi:MAG: hypothetical protein GY842_16640, partial [bacterium]|nr:hypothetical protein [bacterium]